MTATTYSKNVFFIDLEDTIIWSFGDPRLMNVERIRNFLQKNGATELHIFSYAIYNDHDKQVFEQNIKPDIEEALGLPILTWPSIQEMVKADFALTGIHFDAVYEVTEYIQLRGKKDGFINYVNSVCGAFDRAVLIDDVVPDLTLTHRIKGWAIELWNVDSI